MSLRPSAARPASRPCPPDKNFAISIARGGRTHRMKLPPVAFYSIAALLPALGAVYLGATAYLFFRDDMIAALMARQARQQYAYEDRLAALRLQIDRMAGRQMLDQDSFDGKLRDMASRQARIETRAAVLASLGDALGPAAAGDTKAQSAVSRTVAPTPGLSYAPIAPASWSRARPVPGPVEAEAPIDNPEPAPPRPRPDDGGLRPSADAGDAISTGRPRPAGMTLADLASDDVPASLRLGTLSAAIDKTERQQIAVLRRLEGPAVALADKLRSAIAATGLTARLKLAAGKEPAGVGGPYIPLRIDPKASDFDAQLARTQTAVLSVDTLRRAIPSVPLRKPLAGPLEETSRFGYRLDPFLGRPALHSGLDFRGSYGAPVKATAAGKVVTAGPAGGYGNLVEIDHGNGVSTRYGHLSAILVTEGQIVQVGAVVGRLGSTGRSTGNHLHYEVRIDDEAVDPTRFIKASDLLAGL